MLGYFNNFPGNIHRTENFCTKLSRRSIQQKLIRMFRIINQEQYSFEQIGIPTQAGCTVIFEFGIAEANAFNFLNEQETEKILRFIDAGPFNIIDCFCSLRYYKSIKEKKQPLKFDYYLLRFAFTEKGVIEVSVCHERGPRYLSPEDLVSFIERQVNGDSRKKALVAAS